MMEEKLKKVNSLGGAINNWTKIVVGLVLVILGVGTTYYQIESNAADNARQDLQFKESTKQQEQHFDELLETMNREFEISAERSDKRYLRAMSAAEELHKHDDEQEKQLLELTKELWYIKGKLDEQDRH